LETTWRCGCSCPQCFHLNHPNFRKPIDVPIEEVKAVLEKAREGQLDHAVLVGYGEPSLSPDTPAIIDHAHSLGMSTSMITTGVTGLGRFQGYHRQGMDHLHFSTHGLGKTFDEIVGVRGYFARQEELKEWCASESWPFRTNISIQQLNYKHLDDIVRHEIERGAYHIVLLNYLPHCKSPEQIRKVAVDPKLLRPYLEEAAWRVLQESNVYLTIRYLPFCHLAEDLWPYVVNARYVPYDNTEWQYCLTTEAAAVEKLAVELGEMAGIRGEPCFGCKAKQWCGGWNSAMAAVFPGCARSIQAVPRRHLALDGMYGAMHDLNPATRIPSRLRETLL